jgi:hypothetical protein
VSANINLGQLIDLKASQGMEMGVAMVKDGYDNFNPAITLKGTRSISVDVAGMVEAAVNVTVSATVCTQDNEIDAVQGKLTLVVSAGMNIAQALMASGISREVAQQIAQVNMLNGGLVTDVTGEIELSYTVSGLKGNVKTPLEALEFALKHGKVEAHLSLSTSVSNGTEVLGNGFSTNVTNGQKQRVYPPDGSDQLLFTAPSSILVPQKPQLLINSSGGGGGSW